MGDFFSKRLRRHQKRMLKYMRCVLNDHFVLVLLFLLGAISFYYSGLLESIPKGFIGAVLAVAAIWLAVLHFGRLATLAQEADQVFLLPKEKAMKSYFAKSLSYSVLFPFAVLLFISGMTMPLLIVGTGYALSSFIWFLLALWGLKFGHLIIQYYRLFQHEEKTNRHAYTIWLALSVLSLLGGVFVTPWLATIVAFCQLGILIWLYWQKNEEALDWEKLVTTEKERIHRIYQFINLFTDVPEISGKVKRRKYLDPLLNQISRQHENTYLYLYARRMLRGSEFSGLYLRLVIIAGILLFFLQDFWFSLGISVLFIYLIGFQLIPLYSQFKYMVLTHLYPLPAKQKLAALQKLLGSLLLLTAIMFGIIAFFALSMSIEALGILAVLVIEVFLFTKLYIPYRIQKMGDEN